MRIPAKTEYACIAILDLAARYGSAEPVCVREIADAHGIPSHFLVQILLQLKGAGLVTSTRGAAGGYRLSHSPDEITLARVMAAVDPLVGGGGGMPFADGPNGSGGNAGFLKNTPVEINEAEVPIEILKYELTRDSGGAGYYRGGLGTTLELKVFAPNSTITARNRDRTRFCAWGVLGGKAGQPSEFLINPDTAKEINLGNTDVFTAEPNDIIRISSSGAGGWGSPLQRDPQAVLSDVRRGTLAECNFTGRDRLQQAGRVAAPVAGVILSDVALQAPEKFSQIVLG